MSLNDPKRIDHPENPSTIPCRPFEEYAPRFKDYFHLSKTEDGIVEARWYHDQGVGGSALWCVGLHRAIHQLTTDVGQDTDAEVFIIGGSGHNWLADMDQEGTNEKQDWDWLHYEHMYYDGCNICEGLVNDIEVPTIGVINGPGWHTEMALLCDITLIADDAIICDNHFVKGTVPGDGIQLAWRMAMGYKRANYAMLTNQPITAQQALEYGMVNEIVPKDKIYDRAREIARELMKTPRICRRVTTQVLRAPLKMNMAWELRHAFGSEMFSGMSVKYMHGKPQHHQLMVDIGCKLNDHNMKKLLEAQAAGVSYDTSAEGGK